MKIETEGILSKITKSTVSAEEWVNNPFWISADDSSVAEFRAADVRDALRIVANSLLSSRVGNGGVSYKILDDETFVVRPNWLGEIPWRKYRLAWREMLALDPIEPFALRAAIEHAGLTQAEFAEKMGLSLRAVQYYVAGERTVRGPTAIAARLILSA